MPTSRLTYIPQGVYLPKHGLPSDTLSRMSDRLEAARSEVLVDADLWAGGGEVPAEKVPLDAGFTYLPNRLLDEYHAVGEASELGQILATAHHLREKVDRVVCLGIGGSYMGARALFEACAHPYHNELSRDRRGGWPRIYFEGNNVDNDAMAGTLDMLRDGHATSVDHSWAIVVISKSGGTLETASAFRVLLDRLRESCGGDEKLLAQLVVPVTGKSGRLAELATALGCQTRFPIPDGVGGRFSIFTAVGLLPAALMGLDVVRLLEGATAMNSRFREAAVGDNPVLDYVGIGESLQREQGMAIRVLSAWSKGLEAAGLWYDQLLAESLGKKERGPTPLTVVNTRDLHSRGQQHQEGCRDRVITNLIVDQYAHDPIAIGTSEFDQDQLNELADKTMPDIMTAAIQGTNQAYREDNRPTADIHLPRSDEASLGEFFQMMMLATVVEGRLIGINPYGQPGVEAYKRHMNDILRGK